MNATQRQPETDADNWERMEREKKQLREWVEKHSEPEALSRLRLEEGFETWVKAAADEYASWVCEQLNDFDRPLPDHDGQGQYQSRLSPTITELQALRQARKRVEEFGSVQLVLAFYDNGDKRTELEVTVAVPLYGAVCRYFLIPEES
jgi:hypothetical protein